MMTWRILIILRKALLFPWNFNSEVWPSGCSLCVHSLSVLGIFGCCLLGLLLRMCWVCFAMFWFTKRHCLVCNLICLFLQSMIYQIWRIFVANTPMNYESLMSCLVWCFGFGLLVGSWCFQIGLSLVFCFQLASCLPLGPGRFFAGVLSIILIFIILFKKINLTVHKSYELKRHFYIGYSITEDMGKEKIQST